MKSITAGYLTVLILFIASFLTGCGGGGSEGASYWYGDLGAAASPQISSISDLDVPGQPVRVGDWIQIHGSGFGASRIGTISDGYAAFSDGTTVIKAVNYSQWSDTLVQCQIPQGVPVKSLTSRESVSIYVVPADSSTGSSYFSVSASPAPSSTPGATSSPSPSPSPSQSPTPSPSPTQGGGGSVVITGLVVTPDRAAVGHRKAPSALGLDDGSGATLQFTAKERYSSGYEEDVTDKCTWSTTSTIGAIDGKGLFTADPAVKYIEGAEVKAVRNGREGKTTIAVGLVEIPAITPNPGGNCNTVNMRVDPLFSDFYDKKTLIEQVDSFYIGQYAITNKEYCEFLNDATEGGVRNPLEGGTNWWKDTSNDDIEAQYNGIVPDGAGFKVKDDYAERPVIYMSWYSAAAFCNWLTKKHGMADSDLCYGGYSADGLDRWGKDGNNAPDGSNYHPDRKGYRLATDVEWEYACRIKKSDGTLSTDFYYWGNTLNDAADDGNWKYLWFFGNSDPLGITINPFKVGTRCPNGIGLYDMLGNQWEFVSDWYGAYTIPSNGFGSGSATRNPKGPRTGTDHVRRGGAWFENAAASTCEIRYFCAPDLRIRDIGFRIVRTR